MATPPPGYESDDSDRRYSSWNVWPEVGKTSQDDTSQTYPESSAHWIPKLDYRPGQRN